MPVLPQPEAFIPQQHAEALQLLETHFNVSKEKLFQIKTTMRKDIQEGLSEEGKTLPMIPSYVTRLPTGNEKGTYLALDLGGTNLRICEVKLFGKGKVEVHSTKYVVDDKYKKGKGDDLFDYIAECVGKYLKERGHQQRLALGFTFSFGINQVAIDKGRLLNWSKGYSIADAVGKDVVEMLRTSLRRKSVDVQVTAVLNDTIGTVLASAYQHEEPTVLGVIFGTGTNAAYVEKQKNVPKWKGPKEEDGIILINTEWGAFDVERRVLPYTKWDEEMDAESPNPGSQRFEKLVSGMYLGEITRRVLADYAKRGVLFQGMSSPALSKQWAFDSAYMSEIEKDTSADLRTTGDVMETKFQISTSLPDRQLIHRLCQLVGTRSARISAAAIAALVLNQDNSYYLPPGTICGDGSVFASYPHFVDRMKAALVELSGREILDRWQFKEMADGSGMGAAALVAVLEESSQSK